MKYGLFAEFYENSSDEKPLYTVFMGFRKLHDGELVEKDNASQQDLEALTKPEYDNGMINVLFDQDYERIRIVTKAITKDLYPPMFYYRLSGWGRKVFKDNKRPLSERFIKLMNQEKPSKDATGHMFYNDDEIDFLGKENLALLSDLHEAEADYYMLND